MGFALLPGHNDLNVLAAIREWTAPVSTSMLIKQLSTLTFTMMGGELGTPTFSGKVDSSASPSFSAPLVLTQTLPPPPLLPEHDPLPSRVVP